MLKLVIHGCLIACIAALGSALAGTSDANGVRFFEQKIRPVLIKECYGCHSAEAKTLRGGLRLDSRMGVLTGGDSGPAVVPGKPEESLLLEALRHEGLAMPPKNKLPDTVVADFERWITLGAPDPRDGQAAPVRAGIDIEAGRRFWSYQPLRRQTPPAVADARWPRTDVDRFLLAALEARKLQPVGDADRATLLRRLTFDLSGLPPTPEEIDDFVSDPAPDAYKRLVDRLLGSPRFGERWGRHWLDVVRFGESLTLRGFVFKEAWRYRDYVIEAFNGDMPYDRFIVEQIAGDLLPGSSPGEKRRQRIATSFLVLGNNNLEEQDKAQLRMDVVDEQLDAIGKAFLAQTIGCARCHDHKFDPIPTRDYYALAGVLRNAKALEDANVSRWLELPLPVDPEQEAAIKASEAAIAAHESRINVIRKQHRLVAAKGALAPQTLPGIVVDDAQARKVGVWSESRVIGYYIGAGYLHDNNDSKGDKTLTFQPEIPEAGVYEVRLAYNSANNRASAVPVTIFSADGEASVSVDMRIEPPIDGRFVSLGRHRFERNGQGYVLVSNEGTSGTVVADAVQWLPASAAGESTTPSAAPLAKVEQASAELRKLEAELKTLKANAPKRELAMSVVEESEIGDTRVHIRGSVHNLGEPAPRGFLQVASTGPSPTFSSTESGRRELATWLASADNPLTARVIVNRVWHWLFGAGLVRTTDNFGTTGETPSHPELLDDLALRFIEEGWSIKSLVRKLVLSRAYQLASTDNPRARAIDPENRLLWRMNRRRLDAECIRDAILAVSGRLQQEMGGPSFPTELSADYGFPQVSTRRSVYVPVFRNALPDLFDAFDFADPSMVVGRRNVSTVAPQALFLMNHPFVLEQSRHAARRLLSEAGSNPLDDVHLIDRAYQRVLGRPPSGAERRIAASFLGKVAERERRTDTLREEAWVLLFQALFGTIDFRYVD